MCVCVYVRGGVLLERTCISPENRVQRTQTIDLVDANACKCRVTNIVVPKCIRRSVRGVSGKRDRPAAKRPPLPLSVMFSPLPRSIVIAANRVPLGHRYFPRNNNRTRHTKTAAIDRGPLEHPYDVHRRPTLRYLFAWAMSTRKPNTSFTDSVYDSNERVREGGNTLIFFRPGEGFEMIFRACCCDERWSSLADGRVFINYAKGETCHFLHYTIVYFSYKNR